jgi:beta-aspartyl-peptidase (threonine type)
MKSSRTLRQTIYCLLLVLFVIGGLRQTAPAAESDEMVVALKPEPVLVIHGGAGVEKGDLTPEEEQKCHEALAKALKAGYAVLQSGGKAVDAVAAAVESMEDSKVFNAGAGAVFNHEGKNELDAAIMDGNTHEAGAVAGVTIVKNPIEAALAVMRNSKHVMLAGDGANQFAKEQGLQTRPPEYFHTAKRWEELQKVLKQEQAGSTGTEKKLEAPASLKKSETALVRHFGTVGAVALDKANNLAAGTSTGGLTGKRWGRVGDSPVIGAGTFADNNSCAVSCTGHGEWFIRFNVAADVAARVRYEHKPVDQAAEEIIHGVLTTGRGDGGLIALDRSGKFAMTYNTDGMYRGYINDGTPHTFIFGNAP